MTKKNGNIWAKIGVIAGALFTLLLVLGKVLGIFGKSYEMVKDVKKIPKLEARIDTVEIKQTIQQKDIKKVDQKMDLLLHRWNIPIPPDSS